MASSAPAAGDVPLDRQRWVKRLAKQVKARLVSDKRVDSTDEDELRALCLAARDLLANEPVVLELNAPIVIVGDLHGQFHDLLRLVTFCGEPSTRRPYLFLGDYVDRGKFGVEVVAYLLSCKLIEPASVYLLRGNHECAAINRIYGFYHEVRRRYSIRLWKDFQSTFDYLPLCARVSKRVLCVHGGLSPHLRTWDDLSNIGRPLANEDDGLAADLMWSDMNDDDAPGWQPNEARDVSHVFGTDVLKKTCADLDITAVIRGHEVAADGYRIAGCLGALFITVFSAPNYKGERANRGAALHLCDDLTFHFSIMHPKQAGDLKPVKDPMAELAALQAAIDKGGVIRTRNELQLEFRREGGKRGFSRTKHAKVAEGLEQL